MNKNVKCDDCGIYRVTCQCSSAYTGKTTTSFCQRFKEHFQLYRESSLKEHSKKCWLVQNIQNYKIQLLKNQVVEENIHSLKESFYGMKDLGVKSTFRKF